MTLQRELRTAWAAIGEAAAGADLRARPVSVDTPEGPIEVGIDSVGCLHLLIPVQDLSVVREDRRSRGVQILPASLVGADGATQKHFADVACRVAHLNEIFERLAAEILTEILLQPGLALRTASVVLDRWRELLSREAPSFSAGQLAGLYAELWTLLRVAERDPARRVDCWEGPRGARHDLRRGGHAVEVKASTVREGRIIKINGLLQLEPPLAGRLDLMYLRLESSDNGESVPGMLARLEAIGASRAELDALLDLLGYARSDEREYERHRFSVLEHHLYSVDANFPRVTPSSFLSGQEPAGVLRVTYYVDLTGAEPAPLEEGEVERVLDSLATVGGV